MKKNRDILIEKTITKSKNDEEPTITLNYNTPSLSLEENNNSNELLPGVLFDNTDKNKYNNTENLNNQKTNNINDSVENNIKQKNNINLKTTNKEKKVITRKKKFVPINLVKAVDTRKYQKELEPEEIEETEEIENVMELNIKNSNFPSESILEQEQMSKYDKFKFKVNNEKNVNLSKIGLGKVTRIEAVAFFTNLLIYPAIFFQVWQTYMTQEAEDIDIYFNTLQLIGGTPEGAVGVIIGYLIKSTQMIAIGTLAVLFRIFLTFYICFGKKGLIYDLFTRNK